MNNLQSNRANSPPNMNLNYRDNRDSQHIRPPQTANNFNRQNRQNAENYNNMNSNSQNLQGQMEENNPINFPKINKQQNFGIRKSKLNISSENLDNDFGNYEDQYQDETQPRVYFLSFFYIFLLFFRVKIMKKTKEKKIE